MQFAFRWMNCLLMREMSVRNIIRMWDTYLVSCKEARLRPDGLHSCSHSTAAASYHCSKSGGRTRRILRLPSICLLRLLAQVDGQAADDGLPRHHHVPTVSTYADLVRQGRRNAVERSIHVQDAVRQHSASQQVERKHALSVHMDTNLSTPVKVDVDDCESRRPR